MVAIEIVNPFPLLYLSPLNSHLLFFTKVLLIVWSVLSPNDIGYDPIKTDDGKPQRAELYCSTSSPILLPLLMIYNVIPHILFLLTLIFQGIICGAASYLAFRSRLVPSLFNESRWIAFSLYNLCLWGAILIVLGYSLSGDVLVYQSILSFGIFSVSCLTLCLLFLPKLWMMKKMKTMTGEEIRQMTTGFSLGKSSTIMGTNSKLSSIKSQSNASLNGEHTSQQKIDKLEKEIAILRKVML